MKFSIGSRGFSFLLVLSVLSVLPLISSGCTKNIAKPEPRPGLETVPFYRKGSAAFNTKTAITATEAKEKADKEKFEADIKGRFEEKKTELQIFDPWIPPKVRLPSELPPSLRQWPKDKFGYPDWTAAVELGLIKPRNSITGGPVQEDIIDTDIVFEINDRLMRNVLFPHKIHTYWLSCKVCHPGIFIPKKGANIFSMYDIWSGKYCGRCHGKVSFQPKGFDNCRRCHRVPKKTMGPK
ncbi:MAG TPA: cytochrome c3 family protein [Thermodesulfobacteriota bacterium]|nr:cytochrome c3 family protein [Thermodesulfobacteriota bacterium]